MAAYIASAKQYRYRPFFSLSNGDISKKSALICLPYAAGGSSTFMQFAKEMETINPEVDVYAVNYPGNDLDSVNDPQKDIETLIRQCVAMIKQKINTPLAVYGHCVGSYVALDLCARLEEEDIKVNFVGIGGVLNHPPMEIDEILAADERHLEEIYLKLGTFKGYGDRVPPEVYDRITRNFKADAIEITAYRNKLKKDFDNYRIAAPVVNIISDTDKTTPDYRNGYRNWEEYSQEVTLVTMKGGGHYFINEKARETARIIDRLMRGEQIT
jgi:surfactin synthase thioesterase subunit